jgi:peptidoglycan/xylan/chitin deacetylase (PgdA/CDA1 family)
MISTIPVIGVLACIVVIAGVVWRRCASKVPILMYHRVSTFPGDGLSLPAQAFEAQMAYLRSHGFHTISLGLLHQHLTNGIALPRKPVVLTFDDGYEDNFANALPILLRNGMTATVFIIGDRIGQTNDWEQRPGRPTSRLMSAEQIRAWREAGLEVGSHTMSHPHLSSLTAEGLARELSESKAVLESLVGDPVHFLCYPYGDFNTKVHEEAINASYKGAVAIYQGADIWSRDLYALPRLAITSNKRFSDFVLKVSPIHVANLWLHSMKGKPKTNA